MLPNASGQVTRLSTENPEFGRVTIYTDEKQITAANVVAVLQNALKIHEQNATRIDYLWRYYKGQQPILEREKKVRPEINNKVVENRANEIITFKTGYLVGEPMQYVARGDEKGVSEKVKQLNDYMLLRQKSKLDHDLAEWFHVCGTAYRIGLPTPKDEDYQDCPFQSFVLDPRFTFVIYSSGLGHKPMAGVMYIIREDGSQEFTVYTDRSFFEIVDGQLTKSAGHTMGMVPIIEYPANNAHLGAFEIVLPLLNALNAVASNRMDAVEQFVQSFLKFINCDIDEASFQALRDLGAIKIKSLDGQKADVDMVSSELNQTQTQTLKDDLYEAVLVICGMPNRNGGSSTSDTGQAVMLRDGWSDAEARAKDTEMLFVANEYRYLRLIFNICGATSELSMKLTDVGMKFTRRNHSDILTKSQVLTTMLDSDKIHPRLAFSHCGMFVDPEEAYLVSDAYRKEQEKKAADLAAKNADNPGNGGDHTDSEVPKTQEGENPDKNGDSPAE